MTASADRLSSTPAGVRLIALASLQDGHARNFVLEMRAGRFHGFVVRKGPSVTGFVDRCPHRSVPLAQKLDDYMTPDGSFIHCSWHGALFRPTDGVCVGGPCAGQSLQSWPVRVTEDGFIETA